jgi:hypothetical protein
MPISSRFELKYIIDESRAQAVANYVRSFLRPSVYCTWDGPIPGEPVISLYLDSPDFLFFRQGQAGLKNRFKLRIRFYDDNWQSPAFVEIKRRESDTIIKDRAMIHREEVRRMMTEGWRPPAEPLGGAGAAGNGRQHVYQKFCNLCVKSHAYPVVYVSYLREAYESPHDEKLRVTLDRLVHATPFDGSPRLKMPVRGFAPSPDRPPYHLKRDAVVLELKFNDAAPTWMFDMVRCFNLERRPMGKYTCCVDALGLPLGRRVAPEHGEQLAFRAAG